MAYHIAYIVPKVVEDIIEADSLAAVEAWIAEREIENSDIIFIEDENGKEVRA